MKRKEDFYKEDKQKKSNITNKSFISSEKSEKSTIDDITELWITVIDVGQGESTLIRYCKNGEDEHVLLVDGGRLHFAKTTIIPTLLVLKVKKIDAIICSHYDADHMEGLIALSKFLSMDGKVYQRSSTAHKNEDKIVTFRKTYNDNLKTIEKGKNIKIGNKVDKECPTIECVYVGDGEIWSEENNYSIGLLLKFGTFKFFLGGDLTSNYEDDLELEHVCAFKCGHHGSKHSTSETFLSKVKSNAAFISAANHSYCHPDDEVIERLCKNENVRKIYLTNCVYNRRGINPNFGYQEEILLIDIYKKILEWFKRNEDLLKKQPPVFKKILALNKSEPKYPEFTSLLKEDKITIKSSVVRNLYPEDEDARKQWNQLASFYYSAFNIQKNLTPEYDNEKKVISKERELKGVVAASKNHFGNIHLIVSGSDSLKNHKFKVYFSDGEKMKMIQHDCENKPKEVSDTDRDDVSLVIRDEKGENPYKFTPAFSLITGPSGEDRQNLTPDIVLELADEIDNLINHIYEIKDEEKLNEVEKNINETEKWETVPINAKEAYKNLYKVYNDASKEYGEIYALKNPYKEARKAINEARELF
jgi:beta-lactamase superfamily II metal-dependent hydrolase